MMRQEGITVLPAELQTLILLCTGAATRPVLRCVDSTWRALLANRRMRLSVCHGTKEWYGLSCGLTRCMRRSDCLRRFATRIVHTRQWAVLEWLQISPTKHNVRDTIEDKAFKVAAADGDLERLNTLLQQGFVLCPLRVINGAAKYGHCHVIEWLTAREALSNESKRDAMTKVARHGHFDLLKHLYHIGWPLNERVWLSAFEHGNVDTIEWLRDHNCPRSFLVCEKMAKSGSLDMLQFAHTLGCWWDGDTCVKAAGRGHLHILQWACDNHCPGVFHARESAAKGGHLHIIEWLRSTGCPWSGPMLFGAARNGHLEVIQWMFANGFPLHLYDGVCYAAEGGHLEVVQWLLANGGLWRGSVYRAAIRNGHLHVAQWAHANGYPWDDQDGPETEATLLPLMCARAASRGDLDMLQWLWSIRRVDDPDLYATAAHSGCIHIIVWLHGQQCPWDARVIEKALAAGHWNIVEWVRERGCLGG